MEYRNVLTTCPYCGTGCGLHLQVLDGKVVGTLPVKGHPISEGALCIKGWNAHSFIHHPDRLTSPLIKEQGRFREASWDEAYDLIVDEFSSLKEEFGPDSLAVLSSAKCTNEENYLLQKFTRAVLGTNNVDHCARLCHSSTVAGLAASFGSGAMTNSVPDLEEADCILIVGSNTTEQHPIIGTRFLRAQEERGTKLIVADPRRIQMAQHADLWLRQRPGSDVAWLNGVMNIIINEGLADEEFITNRVEGFEEVKQVVAQYTPDVVERISGIPQDELRQAALMYGRAERAAIVYAMGITQHTSGVDHVKACANLAMITGNLGRSGTGVNPLRGQNNVQGACDVGALVNVYPGYQSVVNPEFKQKFEEAWGVTGLPDQVGLTVTEMTAAAESGQVKAMYVMAENPVLSDPDSNHVRKALQALDLLVIQDIFLTETAELADVVLPGCSYAERDGTITGTDRRIQLIREAIPPLADSKADWVIICELAQRMGASGFNYESPAQIMDEIAGLTPIYGGVSYQRLEELGFLQWPCRTPEEPGTPYLHQGQFTRGRGKMHVLEYQDPAEMPDEEYPFILTTGRNMFQFHTGSMTRRSPKLEQESPEGYVEVNPEDAAELGVGDRGQVKLISRRGEIQAKAWVTDRVPRGLVFAPFHYAEAAANVLTNPAVDPQAKIPEFKVCAVRLEAA